MEPLKTCTAFRGTDRIATGSPDALVARLRGQADGVLVFDDTTGRVVDLDWRESAPSTAVEPTPQPPRKRGRPKLGVVPREVTLLPDHWEWLSLQPGGASQALRRLVMAARKADDGKTQRRAAQERTYRVMSAMAGDFEGFEEATRRLFAAEAQDFAAAIASWPGDVKDYLLTLSSPLPDT